jgi:Lysylphosphatidylglycerol synthase TM region
MGGRLRTIGRWLARGVNLRVLIATLVALALFGYVVDIASHGDLAGKLGEILSRMGLAGALLAVPYFGLRALTWHMLLDQVGVAAPLRETTAAFCAGELTKSLPGGIYLETYVLARIERLREREIVDAAVATTGVDVMVGTVTFLTAMVIGLPDREWFRLMLIAMAGAWIVVFGVVLGMIRWWRPQEREAASRWSRTIGRILVEAAEGAARLVRPAVVRPLAATAIYLLLYAVVLWMILQAVDLDAIGFVAAVSVVAITSLANDMLPIPTELGLTEITGVGVLGAYGVAAPDAAIVMLGYRVVTTGALTIVVLAVIAALRGAFVTRESEALPPPNAG